MNDSSVSDSVLKFLSNETYEFSIPKEDWDNIFSSDPKKSQSSTAVFFGDINRTLRKYCISVSEYITMMKQYGFMTAILSAWERFSNNLFHLSTQISKIFGKNHTPNIRVPVGLVIQQVNSRILHFGYKNWKKYVLDQRFITAELLSIIELFNELIKEQIPSNVQLIAQYPFNEISFSKHILKLINLLPKNKFTEKEYFLANMIAKYIHLFVKHPLLYPEKIRSDIEECAMLSDTLYVYMRYNPELYLQVKDELIRQIKEIEPFLESFIPTIPKFYSPFDNSEYTSLLKMICLCTPEEYVKKYIPSQMSYFPTPPFRKVEEKHCKYDFDFFLKVMDPLYDRAMSIMKGNSDAIRTFSRKFCYRFLQIEELTKGFSTLFENRNRDYLQAIWRMIEPLPQYVIALSDAFISYFKNRLDKEIKDRNDEKLQELVATINGLVDSDFHHHLTLVFGRSSLFIPYQKDSDLVGRARVLIEQAHNPSKKNYSIAELFDIVPFVKNRRDLFKGIANFLQNQLLSQVDPNVEHERTLINAMGQFTESDYIKPLQDMLKEFASRYDDFNKIFELSKKEKNFTFNDNMKIAVLSNTRWKQIVQRGKFPFFEEFENSRNYFERKFIESKANSLLFWCDPASVVEVKLKMNGRYDFFLFNGVQYGIVRLLLRGENTYQDFIKYIKVEDLQEQLSTLVDTGLVKPLPNKPNTYLLSSTIDERLYRNFAKKFTSAENIAIMKMKELDRKNAVNTMIVSQVKKAGPNGIKITNLIKVVQKISIRFFSIPPDFIREQIRKLEITKYIKLKDDTDDIYVFNP